MSMRWSDASEAISLLYRLSIHHSLSSRLLCKRLNIENALTSVLDNRIEIGYLLMTPYPPVDAGALPFEKGKGRGWGWEINNNF